MKIPLMKPFINDDIKQKVMDVLESGYLTEGPVTHRFEEACKAYIGCRNCIAVSSCTVGLEMALRCVGIRPGDEVIVPDFTYPATADAVTIVGAKAVLVDVNPSTMLIDYTEIEKAINQKTKAIIPVSLFGNPLDYDRLNSIKEKHKVYIVEDAACSIGAEYKGNRVGAQADITVFSLHPRKFITTGEGGLVTTGDDSWADWMNSYKMFGIDTEQPKEEARFIRFGTNYKLSDVLSAIGLGQIHYIDDLLAERKKLAINYIRLLEGIRGVNFPETTPGGSHSYQSFCIFVENRDYVLRGLRSQGIEVQIGTYSLHHEPAFSISRLCAIKGSMNGSDQVHRTCLTLPIYHRMTLENQELVVNTLKYFLEG